MNREKVKFKFQNVLEAAPDAVVAIDLFGKIVFINELTEIMFGYSREELLGMPVEILLPKRYEDVHVEYRNNYLKNPKTRVMGEGKALRGLKKNGKEFQVEISLATIDSEHGTIVISIIRDVGQRVQFEAQFKGLLESAPDGIVVVNKDGHIIIVNSQVEIMFGYDRNELLGQAIEILVPTPYQKSHINLRNSYISNPKTRPMGAGRALTGKRKDESEFPVEISLSPLETDQGTLVMSIIRDITERRYADEQLQASLKEKEVLLKEIHHRVKNNLQVTSSLLRLQSVHIQDPKVKGLFMESQNRIRSMALIHEKLYQSKNLTKINFREYISTLADLLMRSFGVNPSQISFKITGNDIFLSLDTAIPCGLMVNEIVSNCIKHAFPDGRTGTITAGIFFNENDFFIQIKDDGIGLKRDINFEHLESLGVQLIRTITKQLNGNLEVTNLFPGTSFQMKFPQPKEQFDGK